ncbi:MAG: BREX system ATP-binding protein BrxD [Microthrixaceae bacterium]|nr:BREX system ATP-binding protein BrxD [Microthrixaceae bacterium]
MTAPTPSKARRDEVIDALRRGTVPARGLDLLAVGLERFGPSIDDELARAATGGGVFKCIRGEWGSGKTFASRWIADRARRAGFVTSEIQISETETPLHQLQTVYRRLVERLAVGDGDTGAFRSLIDGWFFVLEEDVLADGTVDEHDEAALVAGTDRLLEARLAEVSRTNPTFATVLRAYRRATLDGDLATADGLVAWLGGQPNVAASVKRYAGIKGDVDHAGALSFLQGLLTMIRDSGNSGLLVIIDEVETLQRVRSDVRDKSLNALRQLIDEVDGGRFPGLYLLITGTPAFFDGPQGVQRLAPLAQRLAVDFSGDPRFDNPRAVQIRLSGFDHDRLVELGTNVRAVFVAGSPAAERVESMVDDRYVGDLADAVAGKLGGQVGIAPRLFLKKLVGDVLDRVELFDDFDPRRDYQLTVGDAELSDIERNAERGAEQGSVPGSEPGSAPGPAGLGPDDIDLDLNLDLGTDQG